uniref:Ran GTPase binding protein n=1 Tax=Solanum tuberosum TaxID=4113 RepID=M1AYD0_SOLTU
MKDTNNSPEQCSPQLKVEPFAAPFYYSCHPQIQVYHVPLFPSHKPAVSRVNTQLTEVVDYRGS